MQIIDHTFPTPQENLACDEALLEACDRGDMPETLRLWEPASHFVVLGYSNRLETEVSVPECDSRRIPVLRRVTGGGTVLQGPGVLNYSLVLRSNGGPLTTISGANRAVLSRHRESLAPLLRGPVELQGDTDLALEGRKFSGNAQRRRKNALLFHGTFLLGLDLRLLEELLPAPARQPAYRAGRPHREFVVNLPLSFQVVKQALTHAWPVGGPPSGLPWKRIGELARTRYSDPAWTRRF